MSLPINPLTPDLDDRLSKLPVKVSRPLRELFEREHLSTDALDTILDAGDLSGQTHKLLAFAVSFHHLTAQGIQVDDVIHMAKSQGRRIRLDWKPKRWSAEHNRLSWAETLRKLSADSVDYDLSKFDQHLPAAFPGYLLRSSRRLGMEGFRQRHCIASYHNDVVAGYTAIAAVFVDGKRWTVQLGYNLDPDRPLRIIQAKSAYNEPASYQVMQRIYEALGIEKPSSRSSSFGPLTEETRMGGRFRENLRAVLPVLREHGITSVRVDFDGSGDSGSIEGAIYEPELDDFDASSVMVPIREVEREWDHQNSTWIYHSTQHLIDLNTAIERIVEDYLEVTQVDWVNNDGGFGTFNIEVVGGVCNMDVNTRYTQTNCEFSEEFAIDEEDFGDDGELPALPAPNAA